jgi:hypothetical protein
MMTFEETWNAIKQLCPSAEFKPGDHYGEMYVYLPGIRYPGAGAMCDVTSAGSRSQQEAAARIWARLMDLNALEPLYRDSGPAESLSGRRYELLRWNGATWESVGFDE